MRFDVSGPTEHWERNDGVEVDWMDAKHPVRGPDDKVLCDAKGNPLHPQVLVFTDGTDTIRNVRVAMARSTRLVIDATVEMVCGLGPDPTFAGIPRAWHDDNDETFQSDLATAFIARLVPSAGQPPPWEPRSKPYVESANGLLNQYYCRAVATYTRGPGDRDGKLFAPLELSPTLPWVVAEVQSVARFINYELRSRRESNTTRAERWAQSPGPIDIPDPSVYREFLYHEPRIVETRGVWIGDQAYVSAALAKRGGETVEVYALDAAQPRIYIEHEGKWLGRAYLRSELPAEEQQELNRVRQQMGQTARARRDRWLARATERARAMPPTRESDLTPDLLSRLTPSAAEQSKRIERARRAAARLAGHDGGIEVEKPS